MSDKKLGQHLNNLSDDTKTYIESEIAFYKLDAYKKLIKATSLILRFVLNQIILILMFLFISIGISLFLGNLLGYYYLGFLIIAGVYILIFLFLLIFGKPIIEKKVLKIYNLIFKDV